MAIPDGSLRTGLGIAGRDRRQPKTVISAKLMSCCLQDPAAPSAPAGSGGFLDWLADVALRPGVVEGLVAATIVTVLVLVWLRLVRVVDRVRSRQQISDYLLGVEQALAGDLRGAQARLQRVLEVDPENHFARLLLGKVLAQLGDAAQAHKHHLTLQRAFQVESGENDLELARALLLVGRPAEAAAAAERVVAADPQHKGAMEFLFRTRLQSGDVAGAANVGRRLLAQAAGAADEALRTDVAAAIAAAGDSMLRRGETEAARAALTEAERLAAAPEVALLAARVAAVTEGAPAVVQKLLAGSLELPVPVTPARPNALLPAVGVAALPAPELLRRRGRWRCSACGGELASAHARCARCLAAGRAEADEPALFVEVPTPAHIADAIEANAAHVRRTVRAALTAADDRTAATALSAITELGERAVPDLLAAACSGGAEADTAIRLLQALGPGITPALFLAAEAFEDRQILPLSGGAVAHVVGRVVQGFDHAALPHVEGLFASARSSSRKILIDYFLGLADLQSFQIVLERFPPLEILHRLNKIDGAVLRRFLQAVPPEHFVAEVLLLEPTFYREDELLAAIPGARHPAVLERCLVQRGPSRTLTAELLRALGDAGLATVALRVLQAFSGRMLDHLLAAFVDRDRDAAVRKSLGDLLAGLGPSAVDRLCAQFGPEPTSLDDELRQVLVAMGDAAVPALQSAYTRPGWVERLTIGMFGRSSNRRAQIARTLAVLGTPSAQAALRVLREQESDPNLKLRLQQALHRLEEQQLSSEPETEGGSHEQVG